MFFLFYAEKNIQCFSDFKRTTALFLYNCCVSDTLTKTFREFSFWQDLLHAYRQSGSEATAILLWVCHFRHFCTKRWWSGRGKIENINGLIVPRHNHMQGTCLIIGSNLMFSALVLKVTSTNTNRINNEHPALLPEPQLTCMVKRKRKASHFKKNNS